MPERLAALEGTKIDPASSVPYRSIYVHLHVWWSAWQTNKCLSEPQRPRRSTFLLRDEVFIQPGSQAPASMIKEAGHELLGPVDASLVGKGSGLSTLPSKLPRIAHQVLVPSIDH
ncbi:MAG: hypothetical protein E5X48_25225 [Mesorhizobium sp.]|uniref:hypothetical protein n=1 Tax=Mesorhizobium sp. TaxID=1871066 RepID=UPI0011F63D9A|nr:hypothetical protein [Mesorhizobium sp.]TIQ33111.1 MAG: hypothetical protein E5X48_25225 [Mesorhizobium sp.]